MWMKFELFYFCFHKLTVFNLFLMKLHLCLRNVIKRIFCCIFAFQTQSTGNMDYHKVPARSVAGGRGLSKQFNCRCHTCCYNYLTKFWTVFNVAVSCIHVIFALCVVSINNSVSFQNVSTELGLVWAIDPLCCDVSALRTFLYRLFRLNVVLAKLY